jgi:ABC-type multidrug transport system ATPase subunit/ABC-type transporter Mla maintaining outer membrane lipid asymmetry permease subunit MlaE
LSEAAIELVAFGLAYRRHGQEQPILEGVDLQVPRGSFLLVAGPSGSGKSTLLRLLCGLWETREPAPRLAGAVRVLGTAVSMRYPRALRGRVQAVLQDEGLLDELSPRANVELALDTARRSRRLAPALLAQAGLDQPPSEVAALSGGMRKRVAVARALAGEPELLIFDEPTAGLDADSARAISALLWDTHRAAAGQRTTLVITHDLPAFAGRHDGVLLLDPGSRSIRLIAAGGESGAEAELVEGHAAADDPLLDLAGIKRALLEIADYGRILTQAVAHAAPLFPGIALRTAARFTVEAALFVAVGCATVGGLATFFALRNNPLEGAFVGAVVTGSGKVLVAVLIPLLAGFFFTARIAAGAAARLGTMKRTHQVDALQLMGIRPADYLLSPLVWGISIAMPLVTAVGVVIATMASLLATRMVTGMSPFGWSRAFAAELDRSDIRFALAKAILSGFLVATLTYHLALGPKRSGKDVGRAVNSAIVLGIFAVLAVHAVMTIVQFV